MSNKTEFRVIKEGREFRANGKRYIKIGYANAKDISSDSPPYPRNLWLFPQHEKVLLV